MVTFWLTLNALLFAAVTGYAIFVFYQAVVRRYLYLRLGRPFDFRARHGEPKANSGRKCSGRRS